VKAADIIRILVKYVMKTEQPTMKKLRQGHMWFKNNYFLSQKQSVQGITEQMQHKQ
jgi:hypothetical protein